MPRLVERVSSVLGILDRGSRQSAEHAVLVGNDGIESVVQEVFHLDHVAFGGQEFLVGRIGPHRDDRTQSPPIQAFENSRRVVHGEVEDVNDRQ